MLCPIQAKKLGKDYLDEEKDEIQCPHLRIKKLDNQLNSLSCFLTQKNLIFIEEIEQKCIELN